MASRDYSDSDSELDQRRSPIKSRMDDDDASILGDDTPTNVDDDLLMASEPPDASRLTTGGPSNTGERPPRSASSTSQNIRIKIRPPKVARSERSSLTPPPPITLKFGVPSRAAKVERAAYSSEDDDDNDDEEEPKPASEREREAEVPKRSHKKARKSGPSSGQSPKKQRAMNPATPAAATAAAAAANAGGSHKKSYDWLIPSTAGASHHGPEGRDEQLKKTPKASGSHSATTPEMDGLDASISVKQGSAGGASGSGGLKGGKSEEAKAAALEARRRSHKRRREGEPPGPGKNWRKGLKKGAGGKEGVDTPTGTTPTQSRPGSVEGSPEADPARVVEPKVELIVDDTPFVLADPATLGIPVFSKPIAPAKMVLTTFPKVTPYFTPNNGGDAGPFPRREPVRSWKDSERTLVGIGGGTLKFKSWTRGPPSELTLILQAEKEAQDAKSKMPKEGTEPKVKSKPPPIAPKLPLPSPLSPAPGELEGDSISTPGSPPKKPKITIKSEGPKKSKPKLKTPRPSMTHSISTESIASLTSQTTDVEMGDPTPVIPNKGQGQAPRKSKLAQEIRPEETELGQSP